MFLLLYLYFVNRHIIGIEQHFFSELRHSQEILGLDMFKGCVTFLDKTTGVNFQLELN